MTGRPARILRPFVAIILVLIMVTSGSAMASAPLAGSAKTVVKVPTWQERLGLIETDIPSEGQTTSSRAGDFEDQFEIVAPYPTTKNIMDIAYRPFGSTALLVGEAGLVLEYDGIYFNTKNSNTTETLYSVAWSPFGDYALIGGTNGWLYKYQNGVFEKFFSGTSSTILDIDFRSSENTALLITDTSDVYLFTDLGMGGSIAYLGNFEPVYFQAVTWHPFDNNALLIGYEVVFDENGMHWEGRVFEFDGDNLQFTNLRPDLARDRDTDLYSGDWNPDGSIALIGGWNGLLLSYDGDAFGTIQNQGNRGTYTRIEYNTNGEALLVNTFGLTSYKNGVLTPINSNLNNILTCVDWANSQSTALVGGYTGTVASYSTATGKITLLTVGGDTTFFDLAWRPDWSYALLVGTQGSIFKWDGTKLTSIGSPVTDTLLGVAWEPNGRSALIVGTGGRLLEYFDGGAGDPSVVQRLSGSNVNLWDVDYNIDGLALIVGDRGELREWNNGFATKVPTLTNNNLRAVDWKDASTAYIVGDSQTVLRYRTDRVAKVDFTAPNLLNNVGFWSGQWEEDMDRGFVTGESGMLMEHVDNNPLTNIDDIYTPIDTGITETLYAADWNYAESDLFITGSSGQCVNFHNENDQVRVLQSPSTEVLYGVGWKGNQYALVVGSAGTVMKYWPNLKPTAVTLDKPTEITDNSMKLTWSQSDLKDFHHYEVHMSKTNDFSPTSYTRLKTITDQSVGSYTATGLARDTTYYFKIRVVDNGGLYANSNEVYGHTIIGKLPPAAVTLDAPTDITDSSMNLKWSQNEDTDFDSYELHMSTTKGFTPSGSTVKLTITDQLKTDAAAQNLKVETTYYFRLRVVDKDGLFNDSNEVSGTTQKINIPPTAVVLNAPFNVTDDMMEVNWSQNVDSDFKSYEVHLGTEEAFNASAATRKTTITQQNITSYKFEGLDQLTEYYVRVRVIDTGGLWTDSNEVSEKTKEFNAEPEPVVLYDPTEIAETSMRLNWSRNNDTDFEMYEIHVSTTSGFEPNATTKVNQIATQNMTTYKVTGLTPGITYFAKIRVIDIVNQFADSNEVFGKTIGNAPPEAVYLSISSVTQTSVTLSWTRNNDTDFAKYEVHYSKDPEFTPDPASMYKDFTSPSTRGTTVDGLEMNTTYYFIVRVVDSLGSKNDSNKVDATTYGPDLPPKALILGEPQNVTRTSMELFWSRCGDKDFDSYELHKAEKAGFKLTDSTRVVKLTDQNRTTYNVTGLKANTEYHFVVRVSDLSKQFNDSNEVFSTTKMENQKPISEAGADITAFTTDKIRFNGIGLDSDGSITLYEWDFETDGVWDFSNPITGETDWTYPLVGTYVATLRVTDNEGATALDTTTVTITEPPKPNLPPKVNAGPDQTVVVGETVLFEGSAEDTDGTVVLYEWDFNGDGNYDWSSDTDGVAEKIYDEDGSFKARLRVRDDEGATSTDVALIIVEPKNKVPKASITKPLDGKKYTNVDSIQFDGSSSSDEDGDTLTFKWTDESEGKVLSTKPKFSTTITKLGAHTVILEVSDGKDKGTETVEFTVDMPTNVKPTISITDPARGSTVKGTITISGTAADSDGTVESVCVKIDGGSCLAASGKRDWTYEWNTANVEAGAHTIKAIVTDDRKDTTETSITVTVEKKSSNKKGFMGLPGFEAPVMLAAAALVALAIAVRRKSEE